MELKQQLVNKGGVYNIAKQELTQIQRLSLDNMRMVDAAQRLEFDCYDNGRISLGDGHYQVSCRNYE